jgi:hypothetical protein
MKGMSYAASAWSDNTLMNLIVGTDCVADLKISDAISSFLNEFIADLADWTGGFGR